MGLRTKHNHPCQDKTSEQAALKAWLRNRQIIHETRSTTAPSREDQTIPCKILVHFSSFQDDITAIALGGQAAQDATEGVLRILHDRYGIPLSYKREASLEFSRNFSSIGVSYDLSNPLDIECKPRKEKLHKYREMVNALKRANSVILLVELQRFAGLHTFMARFLANGEFYCNSAYSCLRDTAHTRENLRPVSKVLVRDANIVLGLLTEGRVAPLIANPVCAHPDRQGFSADASGSADAKAEGWGVHVNGIVAHWKWSPEIKTALAQNKLSISPLELLAAAIALDTTGRHPDRHPTIKRMILRSASLSSCVVVNSMHADSALVLEALRIYLEVQDKWGFDTMLQHVASSSNTITDNLSMGSIQQALHEAYSGSRVQVAPPPEQVKNWYRRVLRAALQAAKHATDTGSSHNVLQVAQCPTRPRSKPLFFTLRSHYETRNLHRGCTPGTDTCRTANNRFNRVLDVMFG